ncbi:MAG: lipoyl synthase [bacterium]|nr:lipoyl synthase [bacterium]
MTINKRTPKPQWLKASIPSGETYFKLKKRLEKRNLSTICQEAKCPNISQCWNNHHATFLIMGDICSRNCTFCSVKHGSPPPLDPKEPERIIEMVDILKAEYVVITSVTRDDLEDGGSAHFARIIATLKTHKPGIDIEVLIPDFKGNTQHLDTVLQAGPNVLNHNMETIKRLYPAVNRDPKNYDVSLGVLANSKNKGAVTKSGIMVGLGESHEELLELFGDLRKSEVELLTIGQYLQPTKAHVPVDKFYTPEEFEQLQKTALAEGFKAVVAGPFVRSSYNAGEMYRESVKK